MCVCVCALVRDNDSENVVLFTQLALSLEIGFSNTKFDRIEIEMRNKNIKLHATLAAFACMHIRDMELSHGYHTHILSALYNATGSKCLSNKVSECMRVYNIQRCTFKLCSV